MIIKLFKNDDAEVITNEINKWGEEHNYKEEVELYCMDGYFFAYVEYEPNT